MVDYFSLGIIIYKMVLGRHPIIAVKDNEEQIRKKIIEMNPHYPRGMNPNLRDLLVRVSLYKASASLLLRYCYCFFSVSLYFIILYSFCGKTKMDKNNKSVTSGAARSSRPSIGRR